MRFLATFGVCFLLAASYLHAQCDLIVVFTTELCSDNGTPIDPTDDSYTAFLDISGSGPSGWTTTDEGWLDGGGADGQYEFGPYSVLDGGRSIIITDPDVPDCSRAVFVESGGCDQECTLAAAVVELFTSDNGTPGQCSDDFYTLTVTVATNSQVSGGWRITTEDGLTEFLGDYNEATLLVHQFPLYRPDGSINNQQLLVTALDDPNCLVQEVLMIEPPAPEDCSCELFAELTPFEISPGGTADLCLDDLVSFGLNVFNYDQSNTGDYIYTLNEDPPIAAGPYGVFVPVGTFPVFGPDQFLNEFTVVVQDATDETCQTVVNAYAPVPFEDCLCTVNLNYELDDLVNSNGTPENCSDDFVQLHFMDESTDIAGDYEILLDNELVFTGVFGDDGGIISVPADGQPHRLTMRGDPSYDCLQVYDLPAVASDCALNPVRLSLGDAAACTDELVCIPLRAENFDDILQMQFSINYDPASLEFFDVFSYNEELIGFGPGSIGRPIPVGPLAPGDITVIWGDPLEEGVSLPADAIIIEMCFTVIAENDFSTTVTISSDPTPLEIVNAEQEERPVVMESGNLGCNCPLNYYEELLQFLDAGTPGTCSDDSFLLALTVEHTGIAPESWELVSPTDDVLAAGAYAAPTEIGPFPVFQDNLSPTVLEGIIRDVTDPDCGIPFTFQAPEPADCACELDLEWVPQFSDAGTPDDCFDDFLTVQVTVRGVNTGPNGWAATDGTGPVYVGAYNQPTVLGPFSQDQVALELTIRDFVDWDCSEQITIPLNPCLPVVHFSFLSEENCNDTDFCVPITVENFTEVQGLDLHFTYTDNLLYTGLQDVNEDLPEFAIVGFAEPEPFGPLPPGNMRIQWIDPNGAGNSLPDGDTLFSACFQRISSEDTLVQYTIEDFPTPPEIIGPDEVLLPFTFAAYETICGYPDLSLNVSQVPNTSITNGVSFPLHLQLSNTGITAATSIQVDAPIPPAFSFQGSNGNYEALSGRWQIDTLLPGVDTTLTLQLLYESAGDSLFLAEVVAVNELDFDSTPNNGVDTDGDNHFADDPDDEDDGDGWVPCSVLPGTISIEQDTVCNDAPLVWLYNGDEMLPDGYIIGVGLYETPDADPASLLAFTSEGFMDQPEEADSNISYYLRPIAGPDNGSGEIDFSDNCVRRGEAIPVLWREIIFEECQTEFVLTCAEPLVLMSCPTVDGINGFNFNWYFNDFLWSDEASSLTNISGTFQLVVTDINGCTAERSFSVLEDLEVPPVNIVQEGSLCGPDPFVELTAETEMGNLDYLWSTAEVESSIIVSDPGVYSVTVMNEDNGCSNSADVFVEPAAGECNLLRGRVQQSADCIEQGAGLANWLVEVTGDDYLEYRYTDAAGAYELYVPSGDYTVRLIPYSPAWLVCEPSGYAINFPGEGGELAQDLLASPLDDCPLLEVSIHVGNLRLCSEDRTITIAYENVGTDTLQDGIIAVILPEPLTYASTNGTLQGSNQDTLFFAPNLPLAPGEGGQFVVYVDVSCTAEWGATTCVKVLGLPYGPCPSAPMEWSGGSLLLSGECTEDDVIFRLTNVGSAPLSAGSSYIVIQDGVMLLEGPAGVPPLLPEESIAVPFPANGSTYVLEAEQEPFHPGFSNPILAVEGCGTNDQGEISLGFVSQLPQDEEDYYIDIDCRPITAAYDPNDKQAEPLGYGIEHYMEPERSLEYTIRFQNTGNDTAQTVIIRDTLSEWLDMCTLRPGVSSHPYHIQLDSARAFAFVFEDILLPDSTTSLEASQGFVEFIVKPLVEAPVGTRIENTAAIYFDVNPPIFTNTTFHTLGRDFLDVIDWVETIGGEIAWSFSPNPTTGSLYIDWDPTIQTTAILILTNVWGQEKMRYLLTGGRKEIDLRDLQSGWYGLQLRSTDGVLLGTGKLIKS